MFREPKQIIKKIQTFPHEKQLERIEFFTLQKQHRYPKGLQMMEKGGDESFTVYTHSSQSVISRSQFKQQNGAVLQVIEFPAKGHWKPNNGVSVGH